MVISSLKTNIHSRERAAATEKEEENDEREREKEAAADKSQRWMEEANYPMNMHKYK